MFGRFNREKTRYNKGQAFPFLIALLCVAIILMMITVNLGQLNTYRTDVSVAADSGALAGTSVLSAGLLGLGLLSDIMAGQALVQFIGGLVLLATEFALYGLVMIFTYMISAWINYIRAFQDGMMSWSNAKKTAMQYAFQNSGVDEPRPSFKDFEAAAGSFGCAGLVGNTRRLYEAYTNADDINCSEGARRRIRDAAQSGFSLFMSAEPPAGFWHYGKIEPSNARSPSTVVSGYGWEPAPGGKIYNSYNRPKPSLGANYAGYENYVQVTVNGRTFFAIRPYNLFAEITGLIFEAIKGMITATFNSIWWLSWLDDVLNVIIDILQLIIEAILSIIPTGLQPMVDIESLTTGSPLTVTVFRGKKDIPLGLWKFKYNGGVSAKAVAYTFGETGVENITPRGPIEDLLTNLTNLFSESQGSFKWSWFNTALHLFESKLVYTQ